MGFFRRDKAERTGAAGVPVPEESYLRTLDAALDAALSMILDQQHVRRFGFIGLERAVEALDEFEQVRPGSKDLVGVHNAASEFLRQVWLWYDSGRAMAQYAVGGDMRGFKTRGAEHVKHAKAVDKAKSALRQEVATLRRKRPDVFYTMALSTSLLEDLGVLDPER